MISLLIVNRSVIIHNRSDVVVHYEWKAFATEEDELTEKEMYYNIINCSVVYKCYYIL